MGKKSIKNKIKSSDEFFESLVKNDKKDDGAAGGWNTGPASAMMLDDDDAANGSHEHQPVAQGKGAQSEGMQVDKPHKNKLGIAKASMKRGQRTHQQQKRKSQKLDKAMARVDKIGFRVEGSQKKKVSKLALKHMY